MSADHTGDLPDGVVVYRTVEEVLDTAPFWELHRGKRALPEGDQRTERVSYEKLADLHDRDLFESWQSTSGDVEASSRYLGALALDAQVRLLHTSARGGISRI